MDEENVKDSSFEEPTSGVTGGLSFEIISMTKTTLDRILKSKSEYVYQAIALYTFYCYTANWQKTTRPKTTSGYVMKGIGMGKETFYNAKKLLSDLGLIEDVKKKSKNGQILGHYIRVKYAPLGKKSHSTASHPVASHPVGKTDTNACVLLGKYSNTDSETVSAPRMEPKLELNEEPKRRSDQDIIDTIEAFRLVNPMVNRLFAQKTQRSAAEFIFKTIGLDEVKKTLAMYSPRRAERYAPVITTPAQFANNYEKLKIFLAKRDVSKVWNPTDKAGTYEPGIKVPITNPHYKRTTPTP